MNCKSVKISRFLIVLLIFLLLINGMGCSSPKIAPKTVTLTSGDVTLKYDCSRFESQIKTASDTHVVTQNMSDVMRRAGEEKNSALQRSLRSARQLRDFLRLEELIVADECAHQK